MGTVPFPGLAAVTGGTRYGPPEENSHAAVRVVSHPGKGLRCGSDDDPLAPRCPTPSPRLTAIAGVVREAPKEDGDAAGRVVGHRVAVPRRWAADHPLAPDNRLPP